MKKIPAIAALCFCLLCSFESFAQDQKKLYFGSVAGVNISQFQGNTFKATNPLLGIQLGLMANYDISSHFTLHSEVLLSFIGSGFETSPEISLGYIQVPVLAQFRFRKEGFTPFINAGPDVGFLLFAEQGDANLAAEYNTVHFGASAGAGVIVPVKEIDLFINVRYGQSIIPIASNQNELKNSTVFFTVGMTGARN